MIESYQEGDLLIDTASDEIYRVGLSDHQQNQAKLTVLGTGDVLVREITWIFQWCNYYHPTYYHANIDTDYEPAD